MELNERKRSPSCISIAGSISLSLEKIEATQEVVKQSSLQLKHNTPKSEMEMYKMPKLKMELYNTPKSEMETMPKLQLEMYNTPKSEMETMPKLQMEMYHTPSSEMEMYNSLTSETEIMYNTPKSEMTMSNKASAQFQADVDTSKVPHEPDKSLGSAVPFFLNPKSGQRSEVKKLTVNSLAFTENDYYFGDVDNQSGNNHDKIVSTRGRSQDCDYLPDIEAAGQNNDEDTNSTMDYDDCECDQVRVKRGRHCHKNERKKKKETISKPSVAYHTKHEDSTVEQGVQSEEVNWMKRDYSIKAEEMDDVPVNQETNKPIQDVGTVLQTNPIGSLINVPISSILSSGAMLKVDDEQEMRSFYEQAQLNIPPAQSETPSSLTDHKRYKHSSVANVCRHKDGELSNNFKSRSPVVDTNRSPTSPVVNSINNKPGICQGLFATVEKSFGCTVCSYRCKIISRLSEHMRSHTGEKPFSCTICSFRCSVSCSLSRHVRSHSDEKKFACALCSYRCREGGRLSVHMRIHTGERPFACTICSYRCRQSSSLPKHLRIHTGEKLFACVQCSYRCRVKTSLSKHMLSHSGVELVV